MKTLPYKFLLFSLCATPAFTYADKLEKPDAQTQIIQNTDTIIAYFDENETPINQSKYKNNGSFRKLLGKTAEGWYVVQDFYEKNKQKKTNPFIVTKKKLLTTTWVDEAIEGTYIDWYENGHQKSSEYFANGLREGEQIYWFPNGTKQSEAHYEYGELEGSLIEWDEHGNKIGYPQKMRETSID